MKLRLFAGENPQQIEKEIPKDTKVIILNSKSSISIIYDTEHGIFDDEDNAVVVLAPSSCGR